MSRNMNRKQLQEWLNQFPEDALICTETNNHYSTEGIKYGTLVECGDGNGTVGILFIGNTRQIGNPEYNLSNLKYIKTISIYD